MIQVTLNGEHLEIPSGFTISQLLDQLGLNTRSLAVEINQELRPRDTHDVTEISAGDVLEVVTLVGGG